MSSNTNRHFSFILAAAGFVIAALSVAGCASSPFKPEPITRAQLSAASVRRAPAVKKARQKVTQAKQGVRKNAREYARAKRGVERGHHRLTVAQRYVHWQRLELEKAQVGRELAHAKVALARAQVEAAEAQAVADSRSGHVGPVDVSQYRLEVAQKKQHVASLVRQRARLGTRIHVAHKSYVALKRSQQADQEKATRESAQATAHDTAQASRASGAAEAKGKGSGEQNLQDIYPAGKVTNTRPLEAQPNGNRSQRGSSGSRNDPNNKQYLYGQK